MRKAGVFATLFFVLLLGLPALANDNLDGNNLLLKCKAGVEMIDMGENVQPPRDGLIGGSYCLGLVRGVDRSSTDIGGAGVTLGQEMRVVLLYLQTHPEVLHKPDYVLVHEALHKAFPAK